MRRPRTLRSRLFSWFLGAIVLAIGASAAVAATTRPDPVSGVETMARNVSARLAGAWDDPDATRAFVEEVRDVTGFDVRLVRDAALLPAHVRRAAGRGVLIAPEGREHVFVPVVRGESLLGALEMNRFGARPAPWGWWRFALTLLLVVTVLAIMAGGVANQLARPLESLAIAADRFGGGDLGFRADVAGRASRWVAREVRDVAVSFNRMAERVEATVRGQRELLGAISHELRSPLGRARVALEIARERLPPAEAGPRTVAQALDDVERPLGTIDSILGDLLAVTRAGLADLRMQTQPLLPWLRAQAAEEPIPPAIELVAGADVDPLAFAFDAALLGRVVHNLLVNARAHGHPPDRPLELRVTREGDRARVLVRDRGPGFPEGLAEKAFEPFVRGDAARARPSAGEGYGLGLAIVRRIVEAHGGRAFARTAADGRGGAEVGFELPIASPLR